MSIFLKFKEFIDASPCSLFATDAIEKKLLQLGFSSFDFSLGHPIPKGGKIFTRHQGQIAAFVLPKVLKSAKYLLAHTDAPALKLKPQPFVYEGGFSFFNLETYGSPLLSSYLGKSLRLSGEIAIDKGSSIEIKKVSHPGPFLIFDPAIHLSKEANATLDKGKMYAFASAKDKFTLHELFGIKDPILGHNLYLTSDESVKKIGVDSALYAGARFDNLTSCFAILETLSESVAHEDTLVCAFFYDHEEIGSDTIDGAKSHFLKRRQKMIIEAYHPQEMMDVKSLAYSVDVAHANHPCYPEKFDTQHPIILGKGPVLKHQSQHKYAQDLYLLAYAKKHLKQSQVFTMRNEVGTGSTLGPYFASLFSIPTQDIGLGLVGMHSSCEIIAENDLIDLIDFLKRFIS